MELNLSSLLLLVNKKRKRKRIVSTKEKMMNLVRAVEGETTDAALARLADLLLDPCCSRDLAAIRPLVTRILAVVGPLLLMDDDGDNNDVNPSSGGPFLTKAKQVVVNLAQAAGLQAVIFALDPYLYDDAEHVRLTAIKVLDEIVRTVLVTEQEVPQHIKYLMSDVLKTGLAYKSSVRVRREAALCIASLAKVCAGPPRVEIFRPLELSEADFLKSLCSTIGLLIDQDDDVASNYFAREVLLDVYQLLLQSEAGEIKALGRGTTRAVLEILVQCARLQGEEADAAMCMVVSEFGRQFWGKSEALDSSEEGKLLDLMIKMEEKVGEDAVLEIIDRA